MNFSIFRNKKILVTGHTGFKGSWLTLWLLREGADVIGYSLGPKTKNDNYCLCNISRKIKEYIADIRDKDKLFNVIKKEKPEIIFHLAAQPLVLESYLNPLYTIETNTLGTAYILEAFRLSKTAHTLIITTTDKVYDNVNSKRKYKETDRLGGKDPYSASKSSAELLINAYIQSYLLNDSDKKIATVRAGNVIGGGDWAENRILPDCIRALEKDKEIIIRNPSYTRPWQFVLEPLGGYLLLARKMIEEGQKYNGPWNFGPLTKSITVEKLVKIVIKYYNKGKYIVHNENGFFEEAKLLDLDATKAVNELKWKPCLGIEEAIKFTVDWYKNYRNTNVFEFCNRQIEEYQRKWKLENSN